MTRKERNREYYLNKRKGTKEFRDANRLTQRNYRAGYLLKSREAKFALISAMGGKCQRCGFGDRRAFQFHHTKGGGTKIRRERYEARRGCGLSAKQSYLYYVDMLAEYKEDNGSIAMLCANCHLITHDEEKAVKRQGIYSHLDMGSF